MRRMIWKKKHLLAAGLGLILAVSSVPVCYGAPENETDVSVENDAGSRTENEADVVEIDSVDDFLAMAEQCRYDSWSMERVIRLNADLDLSGLEFDGIAYFNGIFEGNGHIISGVSFAQKGSDYGLFRYVGEAGEIRDLAVSGTVKPTGSQTNIGGLAGVNFGTITGCSFEGTVEGLEMVGAIAGSNKTTGNIVNCTSRANVSATNHTGGIVGFNEGFVSSCKSESSVNVEELEPTLDLAGVDLSTLNLTQNVVNRNNMGGIAGCSTGVIADCRNDGTVGCNHSGYNVGGIAGIQSGIISDSENYGSICGRKDVGGIVGQAEPYVESEYLEDKVRQTQEDISRLNNTLNHITSTVSSTSAEVRRYADSLDQQYSDSVQNLTNELDTLTSAASGNPDAQPYVDQINAAKGRIDEIYSKGTPPTAEELEEVGRQLETINNNVGSLRGTYAGTAQSPEEFAQNFSAELSGAGERNRSSDLKNLADTVDNGVQSVVSNMKQAVNQMNQITNSVSDDLAILTGDEEIILDISSLETAENTDGVIRSCRNYGEICGDLNVGGITGTMNIEYDMDPEFDLRFQDSVNITLRSTVNDVMLHCVNYGSVTVKRNYVGGIAGLQELGFIYDCEAYGNVSSETGNYLGGIAGESAGTIEKSYAFCRISGADYAGGICGNGYAVQDCISAGDIDSEGEQIGSIAGHLEKEGTVKGNYFVSDALHGIDNISYAGVADRITYEELMAMEDIPKGFERVTIVFELEDETLDSTTVAYGGSIAEIDFPQAPEREGSYVEWDTSEGLTDIRQNLTFTAEYIPWKESIASEETTADGKAVFLAAADFYEETGLVLTETDGSGVDALGENEILAYAYSWELCDVREKEFAAVEGHFVIPQVDGTAHVWIRPDTDGVWQQVDADVEGSYLVAELPYGADYAVTVQTAENHMYLLICVGVLAVLIGILVIRGVVRYRKSRKAIATVDCA